MFFSAQPDAAVVEALKDTIKQSIRCDFSFESVLFQDLDTTLDLMAPTVADDTSALNASYQVGLENPTPHLKKAAGKKFNVIKLILFFPSRETVF